MHTYAYIDILRFARSHIFTHAHIHMLVSTLSHIHTHIHHLLLNSRGQSLVSGLGLGFRFLLILFDSPVTPYVIVALLTCLAFEMIKKNVRTHSHPSIDSYLYYIFIISYYIRTYVSPLQKCINVSLQYNGLTY